MSDIAPKAKPSNRANIIGFQVVCYAIIGLVGIFATFAVPIPLERAIAREQTLDEVQAALRGPNPQAALETLRPRLAESAAALIPLPADPDAAIAAERKLTRAQMKQDSADIALRMRWMIGVITVMACLFGIAMSGGGRRN